MQLIIEQDSCPESPADWADENYCFLIGWHDRHFFVPPPGKGQRERFDPQVEIDSRRKTHHIFAVEAYIHSGVVLALAGRGNFPDRQWDVCDCAAVFVAKKEQPDYAEARQLAEGILTTWNQYLCGDVWSVRVVTEDGQTIDSCSGFYGREAAETEGTALLNYAQQNSASESNQI